MPTYQYEAMNSSGQPVKDEIDATSSEEAVTRIRALGYFPTKLKEKGAKGGGKGGAQAKSGGGAGGGGAGAGGGRRTAGRVSKKLLTQFARQLSTLIDAGLPILRSLRILEQQQKPGMMRVAIRMVAEDVEGGSTLSESMERHPKAFDKLFTNMIRAGELGGVLDLVLQRLADFMEKSQALKRKVIGAMIYPIAVLSFALLIVTGLLIWVVPKFEEIFAGMGTELPGVTRGLISFSMWVKDDFGWLVVLGSPFLVWLVFRLIKTSPGGRYFVDNLKLRIPIMGQIISKQAIARFTRTLGTLLSAGVPILEALKITADTSGNMVLTRALNEVHDGVREGESFADPLRQSRIVDPMVTNMIDVGEETGELDKMLMKVADTYDEEVDNLVASLTSLMEPVMVIMLGVIVGFIVVALFMPMPAMLNNLQNQ